MTALQSRERVKGSLFKLKPLMPLTIPVSAGSTVRRAQGVHYAARRAISPSSDQAGIAQLKAKDVTQSANRIKHDVMMTVLHDGLAHVFCRFPELPPMSTRAALGFVFGLFSAAMLGLAAGAVWMVVSLYMRHPLPWLALPLGLALGITIRKFVRPPGAASAVLAAFATALAAVYVNILIAAVQIAGNMGLGILDALKTAGPGMLWELAHLAASPADIGFAGAAVALAAWLAWRTPARR
jgi:hypothetical protein